MAKKWLVEVIRKRTWLRVVEAESCQDAGRMIEAIAATEPPDDEIGMHFSCAEAREDQAVGTVPLGSVGPAWT